MIRSRFAFGVAVIAVVALACGDPDTAVAPAGTSGGEASLPPATTEGPSAAPTSGLSVGVSDVGAIVTDGEGRTLYLFTSDADGVSTCNGECAETWPPFTEDRLGQLGEGIESSLVGTILRDDGAVQVTYNGHPTYYFKGDRAAGDINGHGFGDQWFVFTAKGTAVEEVIIPSYEY